MSKWTQEQLAAITSDNCNLLVSAAAGAGKTAVLVERIIRKITDPEQPVDIDKLLVVTFTKAAASEMRERIGAAIVRQLNQNPGSRRLHRQLTLLNRAAITTLHSFCLDVLRQYFHRLDLDPSFRVADDTEAALLRLESLEDLFEEKYAAGSTAFLNLVDAYGGDRSDTYLQEMVLKIYEFSRSNPWPGFWLKGLADNYNCPVDTPLQNHPWGRTILDWLEIELDGCLLGLSRAVRISSLPGGPAAYIDNLNDDISRISDLISSAKSWQSLYYAFQSLEFSKLNKCQDRNVDDTLKKQVQKLRDELKKTLARIKSIFFARPPRELIIDLHNTAPHVQALVELVGDFADGYNKAKAARSLVDFSDLEQFCLQILRSGESTPGNLIPSEVALEMQEQYAEILVDEYQDINAVQETILYLVSREGLASPNRFMVGDVKQSIYRFRLAEPALFMSKYSIYPRAAGGPELGLDLTRNFRSRSVVIDAVNYLFRQLMTARVGEIPYDSKAELVCGAEYLSAHDGIQSAAGPVELCIIDKNAAGIDGDHQTGEVDDDSADPEHDHDDEPEDLNAVQREARLIAGRIREMVTGKRGNPGPEFSVLDRSAERFRPVRYRDIVVLLRATRGTANTFMDEFRLAGIPAYADLNSGYFAATEVETVISLLKIIDNPRQDIPLAAVLRSPVVGLTAADLAEVRLAGKGIDFYDALLAAADLGETPLSGRLRDFLDTLEKWRTMARRSPLSELVWHLYNETGYYAYVGGMPGGSQRQANLRALYDRARQYEATSFRGLFRFLRFIEKFRETGSDLGSARAAGENEDVVRIISIHKSKGLEFPVVFVAGLGKQFNTRELKQKVLLHKELGIGLPVVDINNCLYYPTIAHAAVARKQMMELLAEEMRILYVAVTRAREKLILVGSVKDIEKTAARWCQNVSHDSWALPDTDLSAGKTFMDWIGSCVSRHPDGTMLRRLANCEDTPAEFITKDPSRWQIKICNDTELLSPDTREDENNTEFLECVKQWQPVHGHVENYEIIDWRLNWRYPYSRAAGKPAKTSVTEMKRRFADPGKDYPVLAAKSSIQVRPRFMQKSHVLSSAERGTAMHIFMQHLQFTGDLTEALLSRQLEALTARELLTPEQAAAIDLPAIQSFVNSPLGRKMRKASEIIRELPFTMVIPASRIYGDMASEGPEKVLVQGVIDCLYGEGDGYVLVDYKTDKISPASPEEIVNRYSGQLKIYTEAVETILGKPVLAKYLYLFDIGQAVLCP